MKPFLDTGVPRRMGQIFKTEDCPTCGKSMFMTPPPGAKGPWTLRCIECDPLGDGKALGWVNGELQPPR